MQMPSENRGIRSLRARVIGGCELAGMGAGNQAQIL